MIPGSYCPTTHKVISEPDTSSPDLPEDSSEEMEREEPPKLIPPSWVSSEYQLLNIMNGFCDLRESMMQTTNLRLELMKNSIEEASVALMQKLKEAATQVRNSDFWSMIKRVANCLLSTLSSLLGLSLLTSGGSALVGGAMVASGLLSLANLVLIESEGWDWITEQLVKDSEETRQKLLLFLPAAVGILAGGFGLVGSVYGITKGAIDFTQQALSIAQTTLNLFGETITLTEAFAQARLTWTKADLLALQETLKTKQQIFDRLTDDVKVALDAFNRTFHNAKETVRSITLGQSQLTR